MEAIVFLTAVLPLFLAFHVAMNTMTKYLRRRQRVKIVRRRR